MGPEPGDPGRRQNKPALFPCQGRAWQGQDHSGEGDGARRWASGLLAGLSPGQELPWMSSVQLRTMNVHWGRGVGKAWTRGLGAADPGKQAAHTWQRLLPSKYQFYYYDFSTLVEHATRTWRQGERSVSRPIPLLRGRLCHTVGACWHALPRDLAVVGVQPGQAAPHHGLRPGQPNPGDACRNAGRPWEQGGEWVVLVHKVFCSTPAAFQPPSGSPSPDHGLSSGPCFPLQQGHLSGVQAPAARCHWMSQPRVGLHASCL